MPKTPKTYYAQRLPEETIAGIKTLATRWGIKEAPVITRSIAESLGKPEKKSSFRTDTIRFVEEVRANEARIAKLANFGTVKSPVGASRRSPRRQATAARNVPRGTIAVRSPILRPNGKL